MGSEGFKGVKETFWRKHHKACISKIDVRYLTSPQQQRDSTATEQVQGEAGEAVVSSYLFPNKWTQIKLINERKSERWRERERDSRCLSLSLSPLLCVHCRNICFLCCSFPSCSGRVLCVAPPQLLCSSQSLSSPSCSHDAPVMTRRRWWELVSLKEWLFTSNLSPIEKYQ